MSAQDLITFNIGGQTFTTTLLTLRRHQDSRIARILDGKDADFKFISGQVFVDRDGTFFKYILDYMRTGQITLPAEFSDYNGLAQEAQFYGLHPLALWVERNSHRSRVEVLELRFSVQETHGFFQIFCSNNKTLEALARRISIFVEHPNLNGNVPHLPQNSSTPHPVPVQRPSHHNMVFHCGTDQLARDDFSARFVTIEPDDRKLLNSTNVLGLLVDTLLKDGFRLIDTRTVSQEEKTECYMFERSRNTQIVVLSETPRAEHLRRQDTQSQLGEGKKK
ncbi:putative potassium channel regulatory protein [Oncorhynchus keta]|uniref:putative potassium channel regulatory protein n=1 Tax=Oncorhynchus keta TaxID=8018 RepID=UPI0015FB9367|nr:putative potassium channel regulatory protein [Oncorhynchus keta]XP_035614140.1 putative potassium channel regulatory protein [Oncorhynchus keta]